jgi:GTP-binding protein
MRSVRSSAGKAVPKLVFDAHFIRSAASARDFPADAGREVAVAGRSNSGKSSAINRIVGARGLARVSKTPGRTQLINFFELGPARRLVDLPGYGFARVPDSVREHWRRLVDSYLCTRRALCGLIVTIDLRRGLMDSDRQMLDWAGRLRIPSLLLLTKADKLSRGAASARRAEIAAEAPADVDSIVFSAESGQGAAEARARLRDWLALTPDP